MITPSNSITLTAIETKMPLAYATLIQAYLEKIYAK